MIIQQTKSQPYQKGSGYTKDILFQTFPSHQSLTIEYNDKLEDCSALFYRYFTLMTLHIIPSKEIQTKKKRTKKEKQPVWIFY